MTTFDVWQQLFPKDNEDGTYSARLEHVGQIEAVDESAAITISRKWPIFRKGKQLGQFPLVKKSR